MRGIVGEFKTQLPQVEAMVAESLLSEDAKKEYLRIFCERSGMSVRYVQKWLPIVAAAQLAKKNPSEKELLTQWISVVEYQ